jgi:hypothetical protein
MNQPIACSLSRDQYGDRIGELSGLAGRALRRREPTTHGERLTFGAAEQIDRELRAAIAAEASCCPFLHMELARKGDELVLDIEGPPEAAPIIAELFT